MPDTETVVPELVREGAYGVLIAEAGVLMCRAVWDGRVVYNYPGGGIDEGESAVQAVEREFQEEVGSKVVVYQLFYTSDDQVFIGSFPLSGCRLINQYFLVEADASSISLEGNGDDVERLEWFSFDGLPVEHMLPVDLRATEKLRAVLGME